MCVSSEYTERLLTGMEIPVSTEMKVVLELSGLRWEVNVVSLAVK